MTLGPRELTRMGQELGIVKVVRQTVQNAGERSDRTREREVEVDFIVETLLEFAFDLIAHVIWEICVWAWSSASARWSRPSSETRYIRTYFFRPF